MYKTSNKDELRTYTLMNGQNNNRDEHIQTYKENVLKHNT